MNRSFPFNPTAVNGVGSWYNPLTWSWVQEITTGYDVNALEAEANDQRAQLQALNDQALAKGQIDDQTYQKMVDALATDMVQNGDVTGQVSEAAVSGALQGYQNEISAINAVPKYAGSVVGDVTHAIVSGVGSGAGSILGGTLSAIPWWVWGGGAVALLYYLGAFGYAERHARSYFNR